MKKTSCLWNLSRVVAMATLTYAALSNQSMARTLCWDSDANPANGQTDGNGSWTGSTNWFDDDIGEDKAIVNAGYDVAFGVAGAAAGGTYTVNNTAKAWIGVQVKKLTFQGGASYTLSGNAFSITDIEIAPDVSTPQTISAQVSYSRDASASNIPVSTISNNATNSNGILIIKGGFLPNSAKFGGKLVFTGTGTGANQIKSYVVQAGEGPVSVTVAGGVWVFSGNANSHKGGTHLTGGKLTLANATAFQAATGILSVEGGTLTSTVASTTIGGDLSVTSGNIALNAPNTGSLTLLAKQNYTQTGGELDLKLGDSNDQIIGTPTSQFKITGGTLKLDTTNPAFSYNKNYTIFSGFGNGSVSGLEIQGYDTTKYTAVLGTNGILTFKQR